MLLYIDGPFVDTSMSAEAYPDRDGRTYNNHGIEHTLAQFTTGDTVHVDADMAAHTGTYTFKSYSLDPDLHITLEDENGFSCGIRRSLSDRDTLLFISADEMVATTVVNNLTDTISPDSEPETQDTDALVEDSEVQIGEDEDTEQNAIMIDEEPEATDNFGSLEPEIETPDETPESDNTPKMCQSTVETVEPSEGQTTMSAFLTAD